MCCFVTNKSVFFILFHYPRVGRFESSEFLKSYSMSKISDKSKDGQLAKRLVYSNEFDLFTYQVQIYNIYISRWNEKPLSYSIKTVRWLKKERKRRFRIILTTDWRCKLQRLFNFIDKISTAIFYPRLQNVSRLSKLSSSVDDLSRSKIYVISG